MKNKRCFGRVSNLNRCSRTGNWLLFCGEHKRQWIVWMFTLVFTCAAGVASIYSVLPELLLEPTLSVPVPDDNNIERAISMAKMEGVALNTPSASEVVSKFYVRPFVIPSMDRNLNIFALISVSPFKPTSSSITFDAGDCRFLGYVSEFDLSSSKAEFAIKSISCTNNSSEAFTLEYEAADHSPLGILANLNSPTEHYLKLVKEDDKSFSVPMFSNALVVFTKPISSLNYTGQSGDRF